MLKSFGNNVIKGLDKQIHSILRRNKPALVIIEVNQNPDRYDDSINTDCWDNGQMLYVVKTRFPKDLGKTYWSQSFMSYKDQHKCEKKGYTFVELTSKNGDSTRIILKFKSYQQLWSDMHLENILSHYSFRKNNTIVKYISRVESTDEETRAKENTFFDSKDRPDIFEIKERILSIKRNITNINEDIVSKNKLLEDLNNNLIDATNELRPLLSDEEMLKFELENLNT